MNYLFTNVFKRSAATLSNSTISAFPETPYQNGDSVHHASLPFAAAKPIAPEVHSPLQAHEELLGIVEGSGIETAPFADDSSSVSVGVAVNELVAIVEPQASPAPLSSEPLNPGHNPSISQDLPLPVDDQDPLAIADVDASVVTISETPVQEASPVLAKEIALGKEAIAMPPLATQIMSSPADHAADQDMQDTIELQPKVAREREEDDEDAPAAKRSKFDEVDSNGMNGEDHPASSTESSAPKISETRNQAAEISSVPGFPTISHYAAMPAARARPWGPMTEAQSKAIIEGMRNLRKNKSVHAFKEPVNYLALNIPSYPTLVTHPMDLSTMERKLKDGKYASVGDYIADFELMVQNAITFNGHEHMVAQSGMVLKAQFESQLKRVPELGQTAPPGVAVKKQKAPKSGTPNRESKPKPHRTSIATAPPPAVPQNYAVGPDGIPTIRRDSTTTDGRPKREIHKPPPRDLPYGSAKPRKKKFQTELRFCDHVLNEMRKPKYLANYGIGSPFALPVDPVALNIPDYFKIIKKPMDLQTVTEKLNAGQYESSRDFEADVRQIFTNCYKFNPAGNLIHAWGKEYEGVFDSLWSEKSAWISDNSPPSDPPSPGLASEDEDEDEEDEEEDEDPRAAQMALIQQQISALSEQAQALLSSSSRKNASKGSKKVKSTKSGAAKLNRKSGSMGGLPSRSDKKPKVKAKVKPVTNAQKQEISNKIGELPMEQVSRAAEMIRASLRKIGRHDLAVSILPLLEIV